MIAKFMTRNKQITFEIEADTQVELFQEIASLQEVFDTESTCGICDSQVRFLHRQSTKGTKTYHFHELVCTNPSCRARFEFGQAMEGGALFPKRKDNDGNWKPNRGWERYSASSQKSSVGDPWEAAV